MSIREVVVTPAMATELLGRNENNRALNVKRANRLADAMRRGEWQYNGDTIRIAKSGRLLDGQHRLSAIEMSGIPQKYIIVDGLDDETFTTIDIGMARSAYQVLAIAGEKNTSILASLSKMVILTNRHGKPNHGSTAAHPTHTEILEFAGKDERLNESTSFVVGNKWIRKYVGPSVAAYCHYMMGKKSIIMRDAFFIELQEGEYSYKDSPIRFLRDVLIEERGATSTPDKWRRIALFFKTFRLFVEGKSAKIVRLEKDQSEWYKL